MLSEKMTRRTLLAGIALLPATPLFAQTPAADPAVLVSAIYARAAKGKGDSGGQFLWLKKSARAKSFSKTTATLWARADAKTKKGDIGPLGFDPVTNSQDPAIKSANVAVEKQDANAATVAATLVEAGGPRQKPEDAVIRYDLVREGGRWLIDDMRGSVDGNKWSLRQMLRDHRG